MKKVLFFFLCVVGFSFSLPHKLQKLDLLKSYRKNAILESESYDRLAYFTDTFGSRFTGSNGLEDAIDWVIATMRSDGTFDSVIEEQVQVPIWVRGKETLEMISPRSANLTILGLGMSIGTPTQGITAEGIVVKSFEELAERASEVPGKIVIYNQPYVAYGITVTYRQLGAIEAAKYGAVASLVRSIAPYSLDSPHTGVSDTATIPSAAIAIEDAELFQRFQDRGERIFLNLKMEAGFLSDGISRNIVADFKGTTYPEEVIVIGGHIDSWDVGTGALDDGGGIMISWESIRLLALSGMRAKRTIRVVMWTNEENGAKGSDQYFANRLDEIDNHIFALESDGGVFSPIGIGFSGTQAAFEIMTQIGQEYLADIGAGNVTRGGGGRDIEPLCAVGVPCAGFNDADGARKANTDHYFAYHHTKADTMTVINREELDACTAAMGVWAFAVADLDERLPSDRFKMDDITK